MKEELKTFILCMAIVVTLPCQREKPNRKCKEKAEHLIFFLVLGSVVYHLGDSIQQQNK